MSAAIVLLLFLYLLLAQGYRRHRPPVWRGQQQVSESGSSDAPPTIAQLPPLLLQRNFTDYRVVERVLQSLLQPIIDGKVAGAAIITGGSGKLLMAVMRKISYSNFPVMKIVYWFDVFVGLGLEAGTAEIRMLLAKVVSSLKRIKASPSYDASRGGLHAAADAAIALVGTKTHRSQWNPVVYSLFLELFYFSDRVLTSKDILWLLELGRNRAIVSDASVVILLNLMADPRNLPSCDSCTAVYVFNHLSSLCEQQGSGEGSLRPLTPGCSQRAVARMLALLLALPQAEETVINGLIDDIDRCGLADLDISLLAMSTHPSRRNETMGMRLAAAESARERSGAAHSPVYAGCVREYTSYLLHAGRGADALQAVARELSRSIDANKSNEDWEQRLAKDVVVGYVFSLVNSRAAAVTSRNSSCDYGDEVDAAISSLHNEVQGSAALAASGDAARAAAMVRQWALYAAMGAYYSLELYDLVLRTLLRHCSSGSGADGSVEGLAAAAVLDSDRALGLLLSSLRNYLVYLYSAGDSGVALRAWAALKQAVSSKYLPRPDGAAAGSGSALGGDALTAACSAIDCAAKLDDFDFASRLYYRFYRNSSSSISLGGEGSAAARLTHAYLRCFRWPSQAQLLLSTIDDELFAGSSGDRALDGRTVDEALLALGRTCLGAPAMIATAEKMIARGAVVSSVGFRALVGDLCRYWRSYERDDPDGSSGRSLLSELAGATRCAARRTGSDTACEDESLDASLALLVSAPLSRGSLALASDALAAATAAAGYVSGRGAARAALVLEMAIVLAISPAVNVYSEATIAAVRGGRAEDSLTDIVSALPVTRASGEELPSISLQDAISFLDHLCNSDAKPAVGARLLNRLFNDAINGRKYSQAARVVRVLERSRLTLDMSHVTLAAVGAMSHDAQAAKGELARTYAALLVGKSLRFLRSDIKQSILDMQQRR